MRVQSSGSFLLPKLSLVHSGQNDTTIGEVTLGCENSKLSTGKDIWSPVVAQGYQQITFQGWADSNPIPPPRERAWRATFGENIRLFQPRADLRTGLGSQQKSAGRLEERWHHL